VRSYRLTNSVRASFMAFFVNISDNHTYRKYIRRHKHTLAKRFGIDLHTKHSQYSRAESFYDEALNSRWRELGDDHSDALES